MAGDEMTSTDRAGRRAGARECSTRREVLAARPFRRLSTSTSSAAADLVRRDDGAAPISPFARRRARALLHDSRGTLRHARGGRAGARRERKDVQEGQAAVVDERERVLELRLGLGRKAGDEIGAEHDIRAQPRAPRRKTRSRRRANGAASCASGSDRRRTAATDGDAASAAPRRRKRAMRVGVGLDAVDRGEPQPLEFWARGAGSLRRAPRAAACPARSAP